jgi:cyclophilin family peptidyl-prolyl cis-trans isomerase
VPSEKRARQRAAREVRLAQEAQRQKRRKQVRNVIILVVVAGAIVGIAFAVSAGNNGSKSASTTTTTSAKQATNARLQAQANAVAVKAGCPASPTQAANHQTYSAEPPMTIDTSKNYSATVVTTTGTFTIELDAKAAPHTVNNFVFLADKGYYNCNSFFRVIPGFVNQTGNPAQTNQGGLPYTLPSENLPPAGSAGKPTYSVGSVAMATSANGVSGDQFFIVAGPQGESLGNTYPLFGLVSSGLNVVQTINQQGSQSGVPPDVTQRMISVTIHES